MVRGQPGQIVFETLSQKIPNQKRASGVAQVVELPPSKHEALSLNPSTVCPVLPPLPAPTKEQKDPVV
jgi:hypothetical protein